MKSKLHYTPIEIQELSKLINDKLTANTQEQKKIRAKLRKLGFYSSEFGLGNNYNVQDFLAAIKQNFTAQSQNKKKLTTPPKEIPKKVRSNSDEHYILDICDEVLDQKSKRQYRFDFLRGLSGTKLPVDAYYSALNLVVEFKERQHSESVSFFDKHIPKLGMNRNQQRKLYDQLRRDLLPQNGITLVEFDYSEFEYTSRKKLKRNITLDKAIIKHKLQQYIS